MAKTTPSKGRGRVNLNFNLDNPLQKMVYDYLREQGALRGASAYVTLLVCNDMQNRIRSTQEEPATKLQQNEFTQDESTPVNSEKQKQPAIKPAVDSKKESILEATLEDSVEFDMAGISSVMDIFGS